MKKKAITVMIFGVAVCIGVTLLLGNSPAGNRWLMQSAGSDNRLAVRLLLLVGADINGTDDRGGTALFYAAGKGNAEMVELLLTSNADADAVDSRGNTALCYALKTREPNKRLVELLIAGGALDKQAEKGSPLSCIHYSSASKGYIDLLLQHGADPNAPDGLGYVPLMRFAYNGNVSAVEALLEHECEVNAIASDGATALSQAVTQGNDRIVQILLEAGADPTVRVYGKSLRDLAEYERDSFGSGNPTMTDRFNRVIDLLVEANGRGGTD